MKLRRRVVAVVLMGAMVLCGEVVRASAQEAPPDLRMLMNLDLFEPRHDVAKNAPSSDASADAPADDSMLDQIRALDSMGYLGNYGDQNGSGAFAPRAAAGAPESPPHPRKSASAPPPADVGALPEASQPTSQPGYDVEGPQP
jgi:hypothetical protein